MIHQEEVADLAIPEILVQLPDFAIVLKQEYEKLIFSLARWIYEKI
jgi:hypothetical protein